MSLTKEANELMPKLVGGAAVITGILSAMSLSAEKAAVLNVPGGTFFDVLAGFAAIGAGIAIFTSRSSVAAWVGLGFIVMALGSAGWEFNSSQAGNMVSATAHAFKVGAKAGAEAGANAAGSTQSTAKWHAVRTLNPAEIAECEAALKSWTRTPMGQLNCTPASDGNRYMWSSKP